MTTLNDTDQANELAYLLTLLSEGAWDAAAWLDTYPVIEIGIAGLVGQLQSPAEKVEPIHLSAKGYWHSDQSSFIEVRDLLAVELPAAVNALTRAQRLTVAEELIADAAGREEAIRVLPTRQNPELTSRGWQMCEVTRSLHNGQTGRLPEGAAGWLIRSWGPDRTPAERWACRDRLVRIEQLVAACIAYGGRARAQNDPLLAHLVVLHEVSDFEGAVFYVSVRDGNVKPWEADPFASMIVTPSAHGAAELGRVDPADDDGFTRLLGAWTRLVPYRH